MLKNLVRMDHVDESSESPSPVDVAHDEVDRVRLSLV